ncbi:HdeD family acid-resistance protein [Aestuariibaculum suncheonense]|uniref:DUF308 domain-containing protein n=1 Tax=Aestuariibaculum suncheonense TaxID=1028745 RepID=A0A8J6Q925_9FLAO|nr:DUF308 domain-containing protein [Aestuariibaculum suncheonense]MBD0835480.1 DUF308 domain-containing protein [Aestuariibaculum suncheonense]
MKAQFLKTIRNSIKHWYIPLIVGLLFVGLGIYTLVSPVETFLALAFVFSISFMLSGISEIAFAIANKEEMDNWGWNLAFGIMTLLIGILLMSKPEISLTTLSFYIGFLILFRSMMGVSYALELKHYGVLDWGNLMIISVLGILFSLLLLWNPVFAGMTIIFCIGLTLIAGGAFSIYLSLKLKKLNAMPGKISEELKGRYEAIKQEMHDELNKK